MRSNRELTPRKVAETGVKDNRRKRTSARSNKLLRKSRQLNKLKLLRLRKTYKRRLHLRRTISPHAIHPMIKTVRPAMMRNLRRVYDLLRNALTLLSKAAGAITN